MKVTMAKVEDIQPYAGNPRTISDDAVNRVSKSIEEFGFQQPIVVDKNHVIIVGHTRYIAAIELGLEKVPIHVAENLTDEQVRAYRIADNKTGEISSWDKELLRGELELLQALEDFDMQNTGFSESELLKALTPPTPPDPNPSGSSEHDSSMTFEHKCPKCGFEYNDEETD